MNQIQRLPISTNLLFVPILHDASAKDDRADTLVINLDSLDAVGRHRTFDHGIFPKTLKLLRRLPREEFLMSAFFGNRFQLPTDIKRQNINL